MPPTLTKNHIDTLSPFDKKSAANIQKFLICQKIKSHSLLSFATAVKANSSTLWGDFRFIKIRFA